MSLVDLSATELLTKLEQADLKSVELTSAFLDRIDAHDGRINAFIRIDREAALAQATEIDQRRAAGKSVGRLAGLPVAVKDLICTRGVPTTCGSRMLENYLPPFDATVVRRLHSADAVILGKTNMDEFAMGGSGESSAWGPTRNPWNTDCIPGGSSSGAAACVAAKMAPLSVGSDTGGSIRQPAGLCGVTGLKPTYGRVSRYGLVAFASSLDQIGPLGGDARDVALLLEVLAGHDPLDSTSSNQPAPKYTESIEEPIKNLKIGLVREHFGPGLDSEVEAAVRESIRVYRSLGATVEEISLPHAEYAIATYYVIAPCEASGNLARYDGAHYGYRCDEAAMRTELEQQRKAAPKIGTEKDDEVAAADIDNPLVRMYRKSRAEGFGPEVKRRILLGSYALSAGYYDAYYLKALKVRRLIREDFDQAFKKVDLIAGPVTATTAFPIGEKSNDPLSMYLVDLYTVSANLAGIPGISLPCGQSSSGLPIGLQLQAPHFEEQRLLRAAHMYQKTTNWHKQSANLD